MLFRSNKLLLRRAAPSRAELARSFHEPQKQPRLGLVLSVEPVRAEPSCCESEPAHRARAFFPALGGGVRRGVEPQAIATVVEWRRLGEGRTYRCRHMVDPWRPGGCRQHAVGCQGGRPSLDLWRAPVTGTVESTLLQGSHPSSSSTSTSTSRASMSCEESMEQGGR